MIASDTDSSEDSSSSSTLSNPSFPSPLAAALDGILDGVIVTDRYGKIVHYNSSAQRMFGFSKDEVLHQNIRMLMPNPYKEQHDEYLNRYRKFGISKLIGIPRVLEGERKDGSVFPLEISLGPIPKQNEYDTDDSSNKFFIATMRDRSSQSSLYTSSSFQEDRNLRQLMETHGLLQYMDVFNQQEITIDQFYQLSKENLSDLGIVKLGSRMKMLQLINSHQSSPLKSPLTRIPSSSSVVFTDELTFGDPLGRGGFGVVYKGTCRGATVAIKKMMASCQKEAELMERVRHRNIVQYVGVCDESPNFYLILECAVCNLKQAIQSRDIPPPVIIDWNLQIAHGMDYLHTGAPQPIIHRDLKPSNVLLFDDGVLKISDFGLSRMRGPGDATEKMSSVGTFEYMAPEVIKCEPYSEKADVFSFGVLMWEIFTKQSPYSELPPLAVAFGVGSGSLRLPIPSSSPKEYSDLMSSCWMIEYSKRPSFREIIRIFEKMSDADFAQTSSSNHLGDKNEVL